MGVEISQPAELAPGYALLTISPPPDGVTDGLVFSVEQPPRGFLQAYGDSPWGSTHAWLQPSAVTASGGGLAVTLGPEHTWNLKPNVTYVLRLRLPVGGGVSVMRMAWRALRMPSKAPQTLPDLPPPQTVLEAEPDPPVTREPIPQPTSPAPTHDPVGVRPRRLRAWLWLVPVLVALSAAAVGGWLLLRHARLPIPPTPIARPAGPLGAPSARDFLKTVPATDASYAEAQRYIAQGSSDALQGALVLLNHAASAGSGPAATAIGRMYDPDMFDPHRSAMQAPDADKALLWYRRAAQANDPEGLYRLGMLLLSGHANAPGVGPEQATDDLRRASQLGYQPARQELDTLHAKP